MKTDKPIVTIVVPTYERDTYLHETLNSIQSNLVNRNDVEVIVLDNASKNTNISRITSSFKNVMFLRNATNLGLFGNWNQAFKVASGQFVCILGDDDVMMPSFVDEVIGAINKWPELDIVYTDYMSIDESGAPVLMSMPSPFGLITKEDATKFALKNGLGLPTISMCYRKSLFDINGFDAVNFGSNDWWYLYTKMPWRLAYGIPKKLVSYRKHGSGISDTRADICCVSRFVLIRQISGGADLLRKVNLVNLFDALRSVSKLNVTGQEVDNYYVVKMNELIKCDLFIKVFYYTIHQAVNAFVAAKR